MPEDEERDMGGADADYDHLFLDAGRMYRPARTSAPPPPLPIPEVEVDFGPGRPHTVAQSVCQLQGWPVESSRDPAGDLLRVPEECFVRLVLNLRRRGIEPVRVSVRRSSLSAAQIESIRRTVGDEVPVEVRP